LNRIDPAGAAVRIRHSPAFGHSRARREFAPPEKAQAEMRPG
jgi:hypothetical protein